jgi:hypothetical protein
MSESHNEQHELERITSRKTAGEPPPLPLNDDALRESWLALGRLLDASGDDFDEAALVANVRRATSKQTARRPTNLLRWAAGLAIAASLLAAALVWRLSGEEGEKPIAHDAAPAPSRDLTLSEAMSHERYAWNDSLDERLADAGEQLIYAAADWRGYEAPYAALDQRMQDLSESLGEDPL